VEPHVAEELSSPFGMLGSNMLLSGPKLKVPTGSMRTDCVYGEEKRPELKCYE